MKPKKPTTPADQYAQLQLGNIERRKRFWKELRTFIWELFLCLLLWTAIWAVLILFGHAIERTHSWFARINADHAKVAQITDSDYTVANDGTPSIMLTSNALVAIIESKITVKAIESDEFIIRAIRQQNDRIADLSNRLSALEPKPVSIAPIWWTNDFIVTNVFITGGM